METLILHRFQIRAQKKIRGFRSRACHRDYFLNSTVDFTFNKEISMETGSGHFAFSPFNFCNAKTKTLCEN